VGSDAAKNRVFAAISLSLAAALALGLAEATLEAIDFPPDAFSPWVRRHDTGFGYAPSFHTRMRRPGEYDVAFDTNSNGFRDDEIGPKHGVRIVLLGDSFASGYGVERSQTFADLLEAKLGVDVVNTAVGGYEIIHQVRFFESRGGALQADLVLYALYLGNDLSRNNEWETAADGTLTSPKHSFPVRAAHAIKLQTLYRQVRYAARMQEEKARGEWEPWPDYLLSAERESDIIKRSTSYYMLHNDREGLYHAMSTVASEPGVGIPRGKRSGRAAYAAARTRARAARR